jgi:hypothetical protein
MKQPAVAIAAAFLSGIALGLRPMVARQRRRSLSPHFRS